MYLVRSRTCIWEGQGHVFGEDVWQMRDQNPLCRKETLLMISGELAVAISWMCIRKRCPVCQVPLYEVHDKATEMNGLMLQRFFSHAVRITGPVLCVVCLEICCVLDAPVLNYRAQQVGANSIQHAIHRNHFVAPWSVTGPFLCMGVVFASFYDLGLAWGLGRFCNEQLKRSAMQGANTLTCSQPLSCCLGTCLYAHLMDVGAILSNSGKDVFYCQNLATSACSSLSSGMLKGCWPGSCVLLCLCPRWDQTVHG